MNFLENSAEQIRYRSIEQLQYLVVHLRRKNTNKFSFAIKKNLFLQKFLKQ